MMKTLGTSTRQKAFIINMQTNMYGSLAEIGAGQEVARYFFQAGGASQTVAKSMSAYDMAFSDAIYGRETNGRYVCQSRLHKMLNHEYGLVHERLCQTKGSEHRFFAFANTVATKSHFTKGEGHGWSGVRFQRVIGGPTHDISVHVRLLDTDILAQQAALGIIGVNLIYLASFFTEDPQEMLSLLTENLSLPRIEINMIEVSGPDFQKVDNRLLNLALVEKGLTNAIMFNEKGKVVLASESLYKKHIQVVRGSFRPPTLVNSDIIKCGKEKCTEHFKVPTEEIVSIAEITMQGLQGQGNVREDFLARVDLINAMKQKVIISNFPQYYQLIAYFTEFRAQSISLILGGYNFAQIFDPEYSKDAGGILSALGQLFKDNVKVFVYPYKNEKGDESIDLHNLKISDNLKFLYQHLLHNAALVALDNYDESLLHIFSRKVLNMIQNDEPGYEKYLPKEVATMIKERNLFKTKKS
ncbi:MAG: hypothetical protein QE271_10200 [Bacteriovoracaceae bacterium]|nr:hypothetical protein [Bacteriovoracaceae bacterium]